MASAGARRIDPDQLNEATNALRTAGETFLLNGSLYAGRDAAHKRMLELLDKGTQVPVDLKRRAIYYVSPVDAVVDVVIGPVVPTTSTRMDKITDRILSDTGLKLMVSKAERGAQEIEAIKRHEAVYLIAVGGATYLAIKAIRPSGPVAFHDSVMEALYRLRSEDMPVTNAVDSNGNSIHRTGLTRWRRYPVRP